MLSWCSAQEIRGISLVFREMWDTTALNLAPQSAKESVVASHISRKTSEMWGTQRFVVRMAFRRNLFSRYLGSGGWDLLQQVDSLLVA